MTWAVSGEMISITTTEAFAAFKVVKKAFSVWVVFAGYGSAGLLCCLWLV